MASSGIDMSLDDVIKKNKINIKSEFKKPAAKSPAAKSKLVRARNVGKVRARATKFVQQRGNTRARANVLNQLSVTQKKLRATQQILKAALSRNRVRGGRAAGGAVVNRSALLAAALGVRRKAPLRVRAGIRGRGRTAVIRGGRGNAGGGRVGARGRGRIAVRGAARSTGNIQSRLGWQGRGRGSGGRRSFGQTGPSTSAGISAIQRTKQTKGRGNVGGMQSDVVQSHIQRQRSSARITPTRGGFRGRASISLVSASRQRRQQQLTSPRNNRFAGALVSRGRRQQNRGGRNNDSAGIFRRESAGIFGGGGRSRGFSTATRMQIQGPRWDSRQAPRRDTRPPPRTAQALPPVGGNMRQAFSRESTGLSLNERFGGGGRVKIRGGGRQIYL